MEDSGREGEGERAGGCGGVREEGGIEGGGGEGRIAQRWVATPPTVGATGAVSAPSHHCPPEGHRRTSGRGRVLGESRPVPPPKESIAKITVFKDGDLGITKDSHTRIKQGINVPIKNMLGIAASFFHQTEAQLRDALLHIEGWELRLALCESGWGASALLSRELSDPRPRQPRRKRVDLAVDGFSPPPLPPLFASIPSSVTAA